MSAVCDPRFATLNGLLTLLIDDPNGAQVLDIFGFAIPPSRPSISIRALVGAPPDNINHWLKIGFTGPRCLVKISR
jgi:hypothetical protein